MPEWTWDDGWILMSLFLANGEAGAELFEIIGAADAINHAIPTSGELSRAFTRFARCGLLVLAGERYTIAPEFLPAIEKAHHDKGNLFESGDRGLKWLKDSGLVEANDQCVVIDDGEIELAYDRYIKALRRRSTAERSP